MHTESIIDDLRRALDTLNKAERQVAGVILEDVEAATALTIKQLATCAKVSEPTVVRLARRLGCAGFPQLKMRLSQDFAVARMFLRSDLANKPRDAKSVGAQVYEAASQTLQHVFSDHDPHALEAAAQTIDHAQRVFCLGTGGSSANMAQEAENRLFRFDVFATALIDPYRQRMAAAASNAQDVFFIISMTGQPQALRESAELARERGAKVVCLTRSNSPLAATADVLLKLDVPDQENDFQLPNRSRYGQLLIVDCLATLVGTRRMKASLPNLKRMRTALVSLHGPTDQQPIGD
ncbi:putative HTH-type transcriptional regulator YbbH [compost metagenome]|jgi:RpiR family carbohydrate utilization transcriptional regulator